MGELYNEYRPALWKHVYGQDAAIASLRKKVDAGKTPHVILLTGPSGVGKTTIARIIKKKLDCHDHDFVEINCADDRGMDMARSVGNRINLAPMRSPCRLWYLDECHQITTTAQASFLKYLEDTPKHAYFILSTTDPHKVIKTVQGRCHIVKLEPLSPTAQRQAINYVLGKVGKTLPPNVIDKIIEVSEGSGRHAIQLVDAVVDLESEVHQLAAIQKGDFKAAGIEIARLLINPSTRWEQMAKVLKACEDEPEGIRRIVLGYCRTIMLNSPQQAEKCFWIIDEFSRDFYLLGNAALATACYAVIRRRGK